MEIVARKAYTLQFNTESLTATGNERDFSPFLTGAFSSR